jgi:acetyltransferase-like isoleucine patch superfamily enzyme
MCDNVRFLPDGTVALYYHHLQRRWFFDGDALCLADDAGTVTSRFETRQIIDGKLQMSAVLLPRPERIVNLAQLGPTWTHLPNATKFKLADYIQRYGWSVGDHTYGSPAVREAHRAKVKIGKYTSIASGVMIMLADHRTDTVSSYPFSFLRRYWPSCPDGFQDHISKGDVEIGNDVWLGTDVFISSGVTIGDGAVVGAKSVVTSSVPPYAIAVGAPARVVRYRFSSQVIAALLDLRWWDWPDEVVNKSLPDMMSNDIEGFIEKAKQRQSDASLDHK